MKELILSVALQLANLSGYKRVTRAAIAKRAKVAAGSINYHYSTMKKLRDAMVLQAVETKNLKVLGQALADSHPIAKKAPEAMRKAAVALFVGI